MGKSKKNGAALPFEISISIPIFRIVSATGQFLAGAYNNIQIFSNDPKNLLHGTELILIADSDHEVFAIN